VVEQGGVAEVAIDGINGVIDGMTIDQYRSKLVLIAD